MTKTAELFNTHIPKVVELIRSSVESFNALTSSIKNYTPGEIIAELIQSVTDLPQNACHLRQVGKRLFSVVAKYTDLPLVVDSVMDLVNKVTQLFNDMKSDINDIYNVSMPLGINYSFQELLNYMFLSQYVHMYIFYTSIYTIKTECLLVFYLRVLLI